MSEATGIGGASKGEVRSGPSVVGTLIRVAAYYVVFLGAAAALLWAVPWLTEAFIETGGDSIVSDEITTTFGGVPMAEPGGPTEVGGAWPSRGFRCLEPSPS